MTSVIAQQIKDNEEYWTFRKWNALKKNVPFSESTDAEADSKLGIFFNFLMNSMFDKAILSIKDGIKPSKEYFKLQEEFLHTAKYVMRPFGIFLVMLGL